MKTVPTHLVVSSATAILLAVTACDGPRTAETVVLEPSLTQAAGATLMPCRTESEQVVSQVVTSSGAVVDAGEASIELPPNAVLDLTLVEARKIASPYLMVDLRVNGSEHWLFQRPLTITLDYSHCPMESVQRGPLTVWLVDPATGAMLQDMGGVDDRASRTITFQTDHFSGYAIAN